MNRNTEYEELDNRTNRNVRGGEFKSLLNAIHKHLEEAPTNQAHLSFKKEKGKVVMDFAFIDYFDWN